MFLHAAFFQLWEGGSNAGQICLGWKLSLLNPPEELRDLSSKIHNQFFPTARLEPFFKKQGNGLLGIFGRIHNLSHHLAPYGGSIPGLLWIPVLIQRAFAVLTEQGISFPLLNSRLSQA